MARRRGRARVGRALLLIVVVVALLLFGADRLAQQTAENRAGRELQNQLGTSTVPRVDIQGFPFLTHARQGSFPSVHVVADDVRAPDQATTVKHVDLRLRQVRSNDNFATSTAGHVSGTATLDYPTAKALTGQPLSYVPEGRVEVSTPTTVMGLPVTALVVGRPVVNVADQTLSLGDPQLSVAGVEVPDATSQALLDTLVKPAPIKGVPFGLTLTGVTAQREGLVAGVRGDNVTFTQ